MATSLVEILDLCGLRGASWAAWKTAAKCADGLPLDRDEQALYERCTGRSRPLTERPDELVFIKGRRGGGSRFGGAVADRAALQPYPTLAPGEQAVCALAAADREQARVLLGYASAPFREQPSLRGLVQRSGWTALRELVMRETRWAIDLRNRATISVNTSHFGKIRGRSFAVAVADEVAFWASETGENPGSEVLAAIRPGLATLRGQLYVISTPFTKSGPLWDLYTRYYGVDDPRVLVWRAPTLVMNPTIPQSVVDDACERDPESAKSEWLAEFRDDLSALVTAGALRACVVPGRGLEPSSEHQYVIVVDHATGSGTDSLAMAVGHLEVRHGVPVSVIDGIAEARPPFDPAQAVVQIGHYARDYGVRVVHGDRVGAGWCEPVYARVGLTYAALEMTKTEAYLSGLALINSRMIELPDEPRLLSQIAGLQRRPTAGGREHVDHRASANAHDDLANVALGVAALLQRGGIAVPVKLW